MPTTIDLREALCAEGPEAAAANELHKSASFRFRIPESSINIEHLLEHLYELQLMLWLAQRSELPSLLPGMTANAPALQAADETLARLLDRVVEVLHSKCGDCSGEKVYALWKPILQGALTRQSIAPIFTLNYDWTFEKLAIERMSEYHLSDGFELLGGTWDSRRLTNLEPVSGKANIALFKLHGSTNWLPGGPLKSLGTFGSGSHNPDRPQHHFEMVYPGHAHEKWFGKESWRPLQGRDGVFGQWIEQEPYVTLYNALGAVLENAHLLVIIGYAFHDQHVNEYISKAIDSNAALRVVVVDPGYSFGSNRVPPFHWLTMGDLSNTDWSRVEWHPGCFGELDTTAAIVGAVESA